MPLYFSMLEQDRKNTEKEWNLKEKIEKLRVLHYHGEEDIPISLSSVIALNEKSWIKEGFKLYRFETEPGLGHDITEKGYQRANEFMLEAIQGNSSD